MSPTSMRRFVATVGAPFMDESLLGYFGRALSVTVVGRLSTVLRLAEATKAHWTAIATTLTDDGEIARVASLLGCEPVDIARRVYVPGRPGKSPTIGFFGEHIRKVFREGTIRRVSPRALHHAQYHRAIWELRPLVFDPKTRERLLDTCPVCKKKLGWLSAVAPMFCDKCVNGAGLPNVDLRDFPQDVCPAEDEQAFGFVTGLIDPDPARKEAARRLLPDEWSIFPNGAVFEAAILIAGALADPASDRPARRQKSAAELQQITPELLALAGRAIIGGRHGFDHLCEHLRLHIDKRRKRYGRQKELGRALCVLATDKEIYPGVGDLIGRLIDDNMRATKDRFALRKGHQATDATLPIEALADLFGVRRAILQRIAESGVVPVFRAQDGRSPVRMSPTVVAPLLAQLKDSASENEAAGMLGLATVVLNDLARRGLIRPLVGPVLGLVPGHRGYSKSSVEQLMAKVWTAARPATRPCRSITFAARSVAAGERPGRR